MKSDRSYNVLTKFNFTFDSKYPMLKSLARLNAFRLDCSETIIVYSMFCFCRNMCIIFMNMSNCFSRSRYGMMISTVKYVIKLYQFERLGQFSASPYSYIGVFTFNLRYAINRSPCSTRPYLREGLCN